MSTKGFQSSGLLNLLVVFLLFSQAAVPLLHGAPGRMGPPAAGPSSVLEAPGPSVPFDHHDPLNCDVCRMIGASRSYLTPVLSPDAPHVPHDLRFVDHAHHVVFSVFIRADFHRRAPPLTLLF